MGVFVNMKVFKNQTRCISFIPSWRSFSAAGRGDSPLSPWGMTRGGGRGAGERGILASRKFARSGIRETFSFLSVFPLREPTVAFSLSFSRSAFLYRFTLSLPVYPLLCASHPGCSRDFAFFISSLPLRPRLFFHPPPALLAFSIYSPLLSIFKLSPHFPPTLSRRRYFSSYRFFFFFF